MDSPAGKVFKPTPEYVIVRKHTRKLYDWTLFLLHSMAWILSQTVPNGYF